MSQTEHECNGLSAFHRLFAIIIFFTHSRVFHTSVCWWFLTGVWVTASLLKSLGLFIVFRPILIILLFGWSPPILLFPSPPVPLSIFWWLYRAHQLQLVLLLLLRLGYKVLVATYHKVILIYNNKISSLFCRMEVHSCWKLWKTNV